MNTLLIFPAEIVLQTITKTCPDGTENLFLCCKYLRRTSEKILKQHKRDKAPCSGTGLM